MGFMLEKWKGVLIALAAYAAIGYLNQFATENQTTHEYGRRPLYDVGHNLIPQVPLIYPDIALYAIVGYFIIRWGIAYPKVLQNYLWLLVILFIGRIAMFTTTRVPPPPREGCYERRRGEKIIVVVKKKKNHTCQDMLYSGHTFHVMLVLLFVLYLSHSSVEKALVFVATVLTLLLIIAARIHYTVDVLIGVLVSILLFYAWPGADVAIKNIVNGGIYGIMLKQTHVLK